MRTLRILGILLAMVTKLALYAVAVAILMPVILLLLLPNQSSASRW